MISYSFATFDLSTKNHTHTWWQLSILSVIRERTPTHHTVVEYFSSRTLLDVPTNTDCQIVNVHLLFSLLLCHFITLLFVGFASVALNNSKYNNTNSPVRRGDHDNVTYMTLLWNCFELFLRTIVNRFDRIVAACSSVCDWNVLFVSPPIHTNRRSNDHHL